MARHAETATAWPARALEIRCDTWSSETTCHLSPGFNFTRSPSNTTATFGCRRAFGFCAVNALYSFLALSAFLSKTSTVVPSSSALSR